jgi:anti-sigma B factor antagonist
MSTIVASPSHPTAEVAQIWQKGRGPTARLRVTVTTPTDSVMLCTVIGEVDYYSADVFRSPLIGSLRSAAPLVVVDLAGVTFFGVAGLHVLIEARAWVGHSGRRLALITGPRCVDRLLEVAGDVASFPTVGGVAEAIADAA